LDQALLRAIHEAPWDEPVAITPYFTLEKRRTDYLVDPLPASVDVVYFDAFAPEKQSEMWTLSAFQRLISVLNPGAVLTTYCAKGEIRRMLASLGLTMERIPGPVGGKREILRGTF
jgi:tRNA U34 5-methylaminomethyl-2-thiouridine-forming methyltransferase MnmC